MSISSEVARLAKLALERAEGVALRDALTLLARMPQYVRQARLDLWEVECNRRHAAMDAAARAIFALGKDNLYAAIDPELAAKDFRAAAQALGLDEDPASVNLEDW